MSVAFLSIFNQWVRRRDGHGMGLPVPTIFIPGIRVPKLKIPGLFQRFLSKSRESQGFVSHGTTLGQPEFLGLLGTRVPGTVPGFWNFLLKHDLLITFLQHKSLWHPKFGENRLTKLELSRVTAVTRDHFCGLFFYQ